MFARWVNTIRQFIPQMTSLLPPPLFSGQGVTCILPILREGVLTGSPEQKEEAAKALGGVIKLTSPEALRPSVVSITGPLIRILGDRFTWTVKTALLESLTLLLAKVWTSISPFDTSTYQCLSLLLMIL